ncbi:Uncharacterized protein APZ42_014518 [Daphnia magna]|uniref:Uncharacterized protein n=1 Tax=Daphnia magna TaxID=35525 RepID=A0A0P5VJY1_9CRUS|nr:Uncharacterized protein APZ42_014518 [Daphnia magna]
MKIIVLVTMNKTFGYCHIKLLVWCSNKVAVPGERFDWLLQHYKHSRFTIYWIRSSYSWQQQKPCSYLKQSFLRILFTKHA